MRTLIRTSTLAALALSAAALTAEAQGTKHVGIIGGVDFATFTGSDAAGGSFIDPGAGFTLTMDKKSLTGFLGGLFVTIPAGNSLLFEPEVLYAAKGAKYATTITDGVDTFTGDLNFDLHYLTIPVLLRYEFQQDGGAYALAGPEVSFNLSCSVDGTGDFSAGGDLDCSDDLGVETNTTFGGVIGLGFRRGSVGLEGRYDFDFGSAFKDASIKNAAWEILLRYQFK